VCVPNDSCFKRIIILHIIKKYIIFSMFLAVLFTATSASATNVEAAVPEGLIAPEDIMNSYAVCSVEPESSRDDCRVTYLASKVVIRHFMLDDENLVILVTSFMPRGYGTYRSVEELRMSIKDNEFRAAYARNTESLILVWMGFSWREIR
jgi:hypothetical protein